MKKKLTGLVLILYTIGSTAGMEAETVGGGFNSITGNQKKGGGCR